MLCCIRRFVRLLTPWSSYMSENEAPRSAVPPLLNVAKFSADVYEHLDALIRKDAEKAMARRLERES